MRHEPLERMDVTQQKDYHELVNRWIMLKLTPEYACCVIFDKGKHFFDVFIWRMLL